MFCGPNSRGPGSSIAVWRGFAVREDSPRVRVAAIAAAAIIAIGVVDYATGPLWSMSVFYLVPIAWATALAGRRVGVGLAVLCGLVGVLSDVVFQPQYTHRGVAAANVALMFVTLLAIVELVHRLRERALTALQAEQQSREFLAGAAHQLRTPLAGIRASVDALLVSPDRGSERDELLIRLGTETARAGRLVNSLLRVARLDQHEPLPRRTTDLLRLVNDEVERARRTRSAIVWTCQDEVDGVQLDCNPEALAEAIANLLDNAGRHARSRVTVRARRYPDFVEITVHDDGPGLPEDKIQAAFQRFVSMDGDGGTGLGLPITQGIAEAHGGTLVYESGSFTIRIPQTTRPARRRNTTPIPPPGEPLKPCPRETPARLPK